MVGKKNHQITDNGDGTSTVTGNCVFIGERYSCRVPTQGLIAWQRGELIQNAMPAVGADDREFLISGISPQGWKKQFG